MSKATKSRILDAALSEFSVRGFHGTTTRSICERAEVNGAALNYHWGSKDKLWLAACEWAGRTVFAGILTSFDGKRSAADNLRAIITTSFDALLVDDRPLRIITWASMQSEDINFGLSSQHFQPMVQFGKEYFEGLLARGELRCPDYQAALSTFWGMILVTFIDRAGHRVFFGKDIGDPEHAARMRASLIDSALAVLGLSP